MKDATWANKRIEPMRRSAFTLALYSAPCGALPLMAHPRRSAASRACHFTTQRNDVCHS